MKCFYNGKIVLEDGVYTDKAVLVENGIIKAIISDKECNLTDAQKIDLKGNFLVAGFIDIHVHGGGGADFMDGKVEDMKTVIFTHLSHGTTTIFPTTMSCEMSELYGVLKLYRELLGDKTINVRLGGLHLEGPFISPKMCGAQRLDLIISPNENIISKLKDNVDIIARISCAPEVDGVIDMANALKPLGVQFSMGHTNATYEQAEDASKNGFTSITHLYSATSGFHKVNQKVHIGVTQAGYGVDELYVELIGDGCHVPKELLRLVLRFKGEDKVCLVTDAMRATGTNVTESYLGKIVPENRVIIDDGVAKLPDKSFFAGSIGTMDKAFRFAVQNAGVSMQVASKITSLNQANLMGIADKVGSIKENKFADFVVLDNNLELKSVYVNGEKVS